MQGNCSLLGIVLYFCWVWRGVCWVFWVFSFFSLELRGFYVFNFLKFHLSTAGASTSAVSALPLTLMLTQGAHIKRSRLTRQDFWHTYCVVVCQLYPAISERVSRLLIWIVLPHLFSGNKHNISLTTPTKPSFTQTQTACGSLIMEMNLCLIFQFIIRQSATMLFINLLF